MCMHVVILISGEGRDAETNRTGGKRDPIQFDDSWKVTPGSVDLVILSLLQARFHPGGIHCVVERLQHEEGGITGSEMLTTPTT